MKKTLTVIKNILVWLLVIASVGMMIFTIVSVNTFDQNNRSLFGYHFYIVRSDSMSATDFDAGDMILVKKLDDLSTLKEGNIISYISQNSENFGETVTHKIRALTKDANGDPGFITYGTTTGVDDETVVTYPYVLGKYTGKIPGVGNFFVFLKTTPGYLLCILLPFLLLIGYHGINTIRLFRRYKKEQMAELQEEKDQIAAERKQAEEMMKELQALKAQLEQSGKEAQTASEGNKSDADE